jgi:hypothetical protein
MVALVAMLALGPRRVFVCDCDGAEPHFTPTLSCEQENACHDENHGEQSPSERHEDSDDRQHVAARDEVGTPVLAKIVAPNLPQVGLLPALIAPAVAIPDFVTEKWSACIGDSPPPGVTVARTVVLLV